MFLCLTPLTPDIRQPKPGSSENAAPLPHCWTPSPQAVAVVPFCRFFVPGIPQAAVWEQETVVQQEEQKAADLLLLSSGDRLLSAWKDALFIWSKHQLQPSPVAPLGATSLATCKLIGCWDATKPTQHGNTAGTQCPPREGQGRAKQGCFGSSGKVQIRLGGSHYMGPAAFRN